MLTRRPLIDPLIIDRAGDRRDGVDPAACHAIVVRDGRILTRQGRIVELEPGTHPDFSLAVYLGRDGDRDLVALVPDAELDDPGLGDPEVAMTGLREVLHSAADRGAQGDGERELASTAVAITMWHANHPRCAVCGDVTRVTSGGWVRHCDRDDKDHYPRTDPAVIVAITDPDDRLLLAHASYWSPRRFSHLAGYVEPGESLEQAVHREVMEEASIQVRDLAYVGSQPWPFPASVMVGFTARVDDPRVQVDGDEITEARFVSREEMAALVAEGTIVIAPHGSIARRMIEDWYGDALPTGG